MDRVNDQLFDRLTHVWEGPQFKHFFQDICQKKSHLVKKNTIIFNDGDLLNQLYFIEEGFVKLYRLTEDGRDATSYLLGPGYVLGIRALTSKDGCAKHYAEALTDLKIITLPHKEYFDTISRNPEHIVDLLQVFIDRLNYTERKLEGFMFSDVTSRIANFLADCYSRFGKETDKEKIIPLKLTHQLIADFVGSFRETVTVSLNKLEKEKIIKNDHGEVKILNLEKLKQYTDSKFKK